MQNKLQIADDSVIECLKQYSQLDVMALKYLSVGADMDAAVCRVQTADGAPYIVKLRRGRQSPGSVEAQRLLRDTGIEYMISPVETTTGQLFARIDGVSVIVYPFVEGSDGVDQPLDDKQWIALGRALRLIHQVKVPSMLENQIRRENYNSKFRDIVEGFFLLALGEHVEAEVREFGRFLDENEHVIRRLIKLAQELSDVLRNHPVPFVLCHSDVHARNVLLDRSGSLFIIDWDAPIMAPKERDLMFIGGGVANVWNEPKGEELFYQGYGKVGVNRQALAYYRSERIVEDFVAYGEGLLSDSRTAPDKKHMLTKLQSSFAPRGVAEIALET